jgi:hypothetical protein
VEEVAQAAGRLELGHVGVQIQAVDAPDFEADVMTDNVSDVGRHGDLLGRESHEGTPAGARRHSTGPNILFLFPNGRAAAAIRRFAGATTEPKRHDLHHTFNGAHIFLGGLRRSFAVSLKKIYDVNPAFGGPVLRDKLWFFWSSRWNGDTSYVANMFSNANAANPNAWTYVPDLTQPATQPNYQRSISAHLTWQINQKNKVSSFFDDQYREQSPYNVSATTAPESALSLTYPPTNIGTLIWTSTPSNRVLIEVGGMYRYELFTAGSWADTGKAPSPISQTRSFIGVTDIGLGGLSYRGYPTPGNYIDYDGWTRALGVRASISYVTGAHAFKFGFANHNLRDTQARRSTATDLSYVFNRGVPIQLEERANPYNLDEHAPWDLGFYAQDQWTLKRLTLNVGLRSDYFAVDIPANYLGPTRFTPSRSLLLPAVNGLESLKDISPRLGAAYDPFGDGKTAVKVALSRYVQNMGLGIYPQVLYGDPVLQTVTATTRFWTDTNGKVKS